MGQTQAKNEIDNSVSSMSSVVNNTVQKCAPTVSIDQALNIIQKGCKNATATIEDIKLASVAALDVRCAQDATASASVTTDIQQKAKQMAEAVSQALNLNAGSTKAQNIARMSMNVATAITNSTSQIIASAAASSQRITIEQKGGDTCVAKISFVDMSTMTKSIADGVQKSAQVATAVTALKQTVDQEAKAKQSSLILLIILAIIIAIAFMGGETLKPLIYVGVPVLGGLFAYKLYLEKKYKKEAEESGTEGFCCGCA